MNRMIKTQCRHIFVLNPITRRLLCVGCGKAKELSWAETMMIERRVGFAW